MYADTYLIFVIHIQDPLACWARFNIMGIDSKYFAPGLWAKFGSFFFQPESCSVWACCQMAMILEFWFFFWWQLFKERLKCDYLLPDRGLRLPESVPVNRDSHNQQSEEQNNNLSSLMIGFTC